MKKFSFFSIVFFIVFGLFAESEGEKMFKKNMPDKAIPLLESEIAKGIASPVSYNYLGISYYQIGDYPNSVATFQKGLSVSGTNKKILAFNAGNSCYAMNDYQKAIEYFSLAISADPAYSAAVLNRANANLMNKTYTEAVTDYKRFLLMEPDDSQNPQIRKMIELLTEEIARLEEEKRLQEEEAARIAEEERKLQEELARLEAEKAEKERLRLEEEERLAREKRAAEEERRRKLLEEVAASLQNTDSTNMLSGAEDLIDYEQESELD